ncbi:hypothetical protein HYT57_05695 [Candidatus Woesearchaeota archaeon]|nr:hypothetical protein [Candidatus Woesearchaeota archaeon]
MKKLLFIISILGLIFLVGCGKDKILSEKQAEDITKDFLFVTHVWSSEPDGFDYNVIDMTSYYRVYVMEGDAIASVEYVDINKKSGKIKCIMTAKGEEVLFCNQELVSMLKGEFEGNPKRWEEVLTFV